MAGAGLHQFRVAMPNVWGARRSTEKNRRTQGGGGTKQERRRCLPRGDALRIGGSTPTANAPLCPVSARVNRRQRTGVGLLTQSGCDAGIGGSGCSGSRDGHGGCSGAVGVISSCGRGSGRERRHCQWQLGQRRPWRPPKRPRAGNPPRPDPLMSTTRAAGHEWLLAVGRRAVQPASKEKAAAQTGDEAARAHASRSHPAAQSRSRHVPLFATGADDNRCVLSSHPLSAAATSSGHHSPTLPPTPSVAATNEHQHVTRSHSSSANTSSKHRRHDTQAVATAAVTSVGAGRHRRQQCWCWLPAGVQRANRRPCRRRIPTPTQSGATPPNSSHHPTRPQSTDGAAPRDGVHTRRAKRVASTAYSNIMRHPATLPPQLTATTNGRRRYPIQQGETRTSIGRDRGGKDGVAAGTPQGEPQHRVGNDNVSHSSWATTGEATSPRMVTPRQRRSGNGGGGS